MSPYEIKITKQALKDINTLSPKLKEKLKKILVNTVSENPINDEKYQDKK